MSGVYQNDFLEEIKTHLCPGVLSNLNYDAAFGANAGSYRDYVHGLDAGKIEEALTALKRVTSGTIADPRLKAYLLTAQAHLELGLRRPSAAFATMQEVLKLLPEDRTVSLYHDVALGYAMLVCKGMDPAFPIDLPRVQQYFATFFSKHPGAHPLIAETYLFYAGYLIEESRSKTDPALAELAMKQLQAAKDVIDVARQTEKSVNDAKYSEFLLDAQRLLPEIRPKYAEWQRDIVEYTARQKKSGPADGAGGKK